MELEIKFNPSLKVKKMIVLNAITHEELARTSTHKKAVLLKKLINENKSLYGAR